MLDRKTYLGGSDIAALLGGNPNKTPLDVFYEKVGDGFVAKVPDAAQQRRMRRGKKLEPYVLEMLQDEHAINVVARNCRYADNTYRFLAAEIDFEWTHAGEDLVCNGEIKTVHPFAAGQWGDADSEDVPMQYAAQSMYGLMITGRPMCQYAVLFGADDLTLYHVERDEELIENIRKTAVDFWRNHVQTGTPPPPRTFEDLKRLWPKDSGKAFAADSDFKLLVEAYQIAKGGVEKAKSLADDARFAILSTMRDCTTALVDGKKVCTYKSQKSHRFDTDRFKIDHGDLYKEYASESEFRVLRVMG